jgi:hypothetical protein
VHSEKECGAATFKGGFGYHPDRNGGIDTSDVVAATLRPGNAGPSTARGHIAC